MKECITHSFACDCREEKFKRLESELRSERRQLQSTMKMRNALSKRCQEYRKGIELICDMAGDPDAKDACRNIEMHGRALLNMKAHSEMGERNIIQGQESEIETLKAKLEEAIGAGDKAEAIGRWMSAALDDPKVCDEMKKDVNTYFDGLTTLQALKSIRKGEKPENK